MKLDELVKEVERRFGFELNETTIGNEDDEGAVINFEFISALCPNVKMNRGVYIEARSPQKSTYGEEICFNFFKEGEWGRDGASEYHQFEGNVLSGEKQALFNDLAKYKIK